MRPRSLGRCGIFVVVIVVVTTPASPSPCSVCFGGEEEEEEAEDEVKVVVRRGEVYGREPKVKTSPETRMGTRSPYLLVRSSRASRLMGWVEGVLRVRGWMVKKSICLWWECGPRTVSMKSMVFLFVW